jgi:hypothetical protein
LYFLVKYLPFTFVVIAENNRAGFAHPLITRYGILYDRCTTLNTSCHGFFTGKWLAKACQSFQSTFSISFPWATTCPFPTEVGRLLINWQHNGDKRPLAKFITLSLLDGYQLLYWCWPRTVEFYKAQFERVGNICSAVY